MAFEPSSLESATKKPKSSFVRNFADPAIFFPAANVCNIMQGANTVAAIISVVNFLYSVVIVGLSSGLNNLPETSPVKKFFARISLTIHDRQPTGNIFISSLSFMGRELSNPLRITSYSVLAMSAVLLVAAIDGSHAALFPGLATFFFGIGNFIQSGSMLDKLHHDHRANPILKAMSHPAIWYGLGYAMTGIAIGGGLALLVNPLGHLKALFLTFVGIFETAGALGLMAFGRVTNHAAPFVGVAIGTIFFALTGLFVGNGFGAATGMFACAGELSLAILMQQKYNVTHMDQTPVKPMSGIERFLTAPIRAAMKWGWVSSV